MAKNSKPTSQKRAREKARMDRQKEKELRRAEARERRATTPPRSGEEDPDLAGIRPEDIEINVEGPFLCVRGRRRDDVCGEGISHYHLEITYSRFEKTIRFPRSIERVSIERDYHDGLLVLRLHEEETKGQARAAILK